MGPSEPGRGVLGTFSTFYPDGKPCHLLAKCRMEPKVPS